MLFVLFWPAKWGPRKSLKITKCQNVTSYGLDLPCIKAYLQMPNQGGDFDDIYESHKRKKKEMRRE